MKDLIAMNLIILFFLMCVGLVFSWIGFWVERTGGDLTMKNFIIIALPPILLIFNALVLFLNFLMR